MTASLGHVLAQIQRWTSPRLQELSDTVLLERFVQHRDESAFAALVARHGQMVLRSCRRVLNDEHEAEDAFQATFLILARQARTLRQADALPGFLHSVARRVALKARAKTAARAGQSPFIEELPDAHSDPLERLTARELLTALDEEVTRLPAAQRSAVVLCCLEGRTQEEAARLLGWTAGSLRGHLERGRNRLQARLRRRGITIAAALAVVAVSRGEAASGVLVQNAIQAALNGGSGSAAALAHSVLQTMFWPRFAGMMAITLTIALAASTTAALVYRGSIAEPSEDKQRPVAAAPKDPGAGKPQVRTDALGDPPPEGVIRRLGTLRFRYGWGIYNLLPTPDGKTLISNEAGGTVSVWDLATGKVWRRFHGHLFGQRYMALSPDGKHVAICNREAIILWELASGKEVRRLAQADASGVAFSPDRKVLAAASYGPDIHLWDLVSGKKIGKLAWECGNETSSPLLVYSPDGKTLIAGRWFDSKIGLWEVASGKKRNELDAKAGPIFSLALSPDGAILATGSRQGGVPFWEVKTGRLIRTLPAASERACTDVAFSPNGKSLAAVESDAFSSNFKDRNSISIWDLATSKEVSRFKGGSKLEKIVYSRDGKTLILASGAIRLLDAATGKEVGPTAGSLVYLGPGWSCNMLSADGSVLAYLRQSDVRLWEANSRSDVSAVELRFWDMKENREINNPIEFDCFLGYIRHALAPDGRTVAVSDAQCAINLWDVRSGKLLRCLQQGKKGIPNAYALAFSPDGRTLASADPKAAGVRLWDVVTGKLIRRLPLMKADDPREGNTWIGPGPIIFSPDSRLLAASGMTSAGGDEVRIWEVATGKDLPQLTRAMNAPTKEDIPTVPPGSGPDKIVVSKVVFSPNGRMLAKDGRPKSISIWETVSGQQRILLKGHEDSTVCIAFAPDGRTLASASWDNTIRLWDLRTGRELRKLTGHRGKANSLAFSADGKILVSAGDDTTILFWDVADITGRKNPHTAQLAEREWQALWEDLAADDAAKTYTAMVRMTADAPKTVAALKERLRPVRPVDPERLARLFKELDSDEFAVREAANRELEKLGDVVGSAVQKMLARADLSLELRRRLDAIAASLEAISRVRLRSLRAIEVLEMVGTAEARELLKDLATGASGARLTEQSKAALERLMKRRK